MSGEAPMRIGVLGGGQLGLMLAEAGEPLGFSFRFLDPNPDAPAGRGRELVCAAFDDAEAIDRFADGLDVATFEFENVGPETLARLERLVPLRPGVRSLEMKHDRLVEKRFLQSCGLEVPRYAAVDSEDDLATAVATVGSSSILKTRRFGYDGKGQVRIDRLDEASLRAAWEETGRAPCLLEELVEFRRELSVVLVRGLDGKCRNWPIGENLHRGGILRRTVAPVEGVAAATEARAWAEALANGLDHVGVLALELFERTDGSLAANEFAPRVHNSGHWTIEGSQTSQFENHLRAIAGLPLGCTEAIGHAVMANLIGVCPPTARMLEVAGARIHLYGKAARPGRKLGHVTAVSSDRENVLAAGVALEAVIEASTTMSAVGERS